MALGSDLSKTTYERRALAEGNIENAELTRSRPRRRLFFFFLFFLLFFYVFLKQHTMVARPGGPLPIEACLTYCCGQLRSTSCDDSCS